MPTTSPGSPDSPFPTSSSTNASPGSTPGTSSQAGGSSPSGSTYGGSSTASGTGYGADYGSGDYGDTGTTRSGGGTDNPADPMFHRAVRGAHAAVDRVAERVGPAVERLKSGVSGAQESLNQRADQLGEIQEQWLASARTTVREHPIAAVAVALAAGVVLSKLLSSSSSER